MANNPSVNGSSNVFVTEQGVYLTTEKELTSQDLMVLINDNQSRNVDRKRNHDLYVGNHDIYNLPIDPESARPDNRIVSNWANYVVDTYVGYFMGKVPTIKLDDDTRDEKLQDWLNSESFGDKLTELAKSVAIYGKSYLMAYQDEQANTRVSQVTPNSGFMVYDTSVNRKPIAFVRYDYLAEQLSGEIYTDNTITYFGQNGVFEDTTNHLFGAVPAVELMANNDRLSVVDKIYDLVNAYDAALSQKANQVEYFDNAYLKIMGATLPSDDDGNPILNLARDHVLYTPNVDQGADVSFLSKPDADTMQENLLKRLKDDIFQTSMVVNLNDESFGTSASGVSIQYKLMSMQNQAAVEERKFTQALRNLLGTILSLGTIVGSVDSRTIKQDLSFQFIRNLPLDISGEADTASKLNGLVSKETQLSTLSIVPDPKKEIKQMQDEQNDQVKNSLANVPSATDFLKGDDKEVKADDEETTEK
ncbi:phage portal protein [Limosilactobacillus gorillae]|uniref:phage portal protein n=1 Tax=Limosilactobacillus gorillae TaxID=1450649 RepID=UPI000B2F41AE|nr:phage portal protein [Limosilactobacillus gorillae]